MKLNFGLFEILVLKLLRAILWNVINPGNHAPIHDFLLEEVDKVIKRALEE